MKKSLLIYIGILISIIHIYGQDIIVGAECTDEYLHLLKDKNIAVVVNNTSRIKNTHLVDSLISSGIQIETIFAPEHGFRGDADAGETVENGKDSKTGIKIISLYGKNKKPRQDQLEGIDQVIFDIQDVGVRFYTYISTMHYVMEACAENNIPLLILDRPNPNGHYTDGPVLEEEFKSFVGMHPIPVVHSLTVGELAQMINGEKWLNDDLECDIKIIKVKNWNHNTPYSLPVKPSPNLPNDVAINLYPSLCFFEPTIISIGRGTQSPFQVIGSPIARKKDFTFTPKSIPGMSKHPKHENIKCYGIDLTKSKRTDQINLDYLTSFYKTTHKTDTFFTNEAFFNLLAGNDKLIKQIKAEKTPKSIKISWKSDLLIFNEKKIKYLLYN